MSDLEWLLLGGGLGALTVILTSIALGFSFSLSLTTSPDEIEDQIEDLLIEQGTRYEVSVVDWGPDFTGEGDILHRYRWLVWDADRKVKRLVWAKNDEVGVDVPFMVGNEPTFELAVTKALDQAHALSGPEASVVVE